MRTLFLLLLMSSALLGGRYDNEPHIKYDCAVLYVVDGDTVDVMVELGLDVSKKERLRLYGVNTPELRGEERAAGIISKEWLRHQLTEAGDIYIVTPGDRRGKYGRLLATVYADGVNLNATMIELNLAEEEYYE